MPRILITDHSSRFCDQLGAIITGLGHTVDCARSMGEALEHATAHDTDVVFLNTELTGKNGLQTLEQFKASPGAPEIIMVADVCDPDTAEQAIRFGAWDYIEKTSAADSMLLPLIRALDYRRKRPVRQSRKHAAQLNRNNIVGSGPGLQQCLSIVSEAATSDASALLYGETGVGKEIFARCIHENSKRASSPFVTVDCASLSRTLAGSILFGHKKGAFTGADKDKDGLVLQAHRGTLFLDEVGELPLSMQKIFLRVLQEHRFRPVGGRNEQTSDFRLICATNRNLEDMVARGTFRSDLLFRMRTIVMPIPPLRERVEDIPDLTSHYVQRLCGKYGMPAKTLSPDLLDTLKHYPWPGNVRELVHTLERSVLTAQDDPMLFSRHLPEHLRISIARANASGPRQKSASVAVVKPAAPGGSIHVPMHTADLQEQTPPLYTGAACPLLDPPFTNIALPAQGSEAEATPQPTPSTPPCVRQLERNTHSTQCSAVSSPPRLHASENNFSPEELPQHLPETRTEFQPQRRGSASSLRTTPLHLLHSSGRHPARISRFLSEPAKPPQQPVAGPLPHNNTPDVLLENLCSQIECCTSLPQFFMLRDTIFASYLKTLLAQCNGNITKACKKAGLSRSYMYDLLKKHNISTER